VVFLLDHECIPLVTVPLWFQELEYHQHMMSIKLVQVLFGNAFKRCCCFMNKLTTLVHIIYKTTQIYLNAASGALYMSIYSTNLIYVFHIFTESQFYTWLLAIRVLFYLCPYYRSMIYIKCRYSAILWIYVTYKAPCRISTPYRKHCSIIVITSPDMVEACLWCR